MNASWQPSPCNAQEKAYQFIKEAILNFELTPAQRLIASDLATSLEISRTPVREALGRLEQEGLVVRAGGWGYLVKAIGVDDVLDLFKVREALEVEAVAEAVIHVERPTTDEFAKILATARSNRGNPGKFVALNRTFHNGIAAAARNELLRSMLSIISDRVQMIGAMTVHQVPDRMNEILAENHRILGAMREKKAAAAKLAVRQHVRRGCECAIQMLERGDKRFVFAAAGRKSR